MNCLLFIDIKFNYKSQFNQVNKNQNESILKETLQFLIEILFKMHNFFPRYMNLIQNHGGPSRDCFSRTCYCSVMLYDQLLVTHSRVKLIMEYSFKCAPSLSFAHNHWDKTLLDNHIDNSLETQWKVHDTSHRSDHRPFSGW